MKCKALLDTNHRFVIAAMLVALIVGPACSARADQYNYIEYADILLNVGPGTASLSVNLGLPGANYAGSFGWPAYTYQYKTFDFASVTYDHIVPTGLIDGCCSGITTEEFPVPGSVKMKISETKGSQTATILGGTFTAQ